MTGKQIKERELLYKGSEWSVGVDGIFINPKQIPYTNCLYELALAYDSELKRLKRKEQECEELKKEQAEIKKYLGISHKTILERLEELTNFRDRDRKELDQFKEDIEGLKRKIIKIFACLIKANRANKISDTLWVDNIMTLWDYIAQTLGIEGDQNKIEEQILQKISEVEDD